MRDTYTCTIICLVAYLKREMTTTEILVVECVESRERKEERVLRDFSSSHEKREDGKRGNEQQL